MPSAPIPDTRLATRLCARLIHDLSGAAQGVTTALGLFEDAEGPNLDRAACELAARSADDLEARLTFARAAFAGGDVVGPAELERISQIPFQDRRGRLGWCSHEAGAPTALQRAMLLFAQLAAGVLALGGEAELRLERDGEGWLGELKAEGPRLRADADALAALAGAGGGEARPGLWAVAAFARALVVEAGGTVAVEAEAQRLTITAWAPAGASAQLAAAEPASRGA
jgi:hypothetical protein